MTEMYEASDETERTRIRGSGGFEETSGEPVGG